MPEASDEIPGSCGKDSWLEVELGRDIGSRVAGSESRGSGGCALPVESSTSDRNGGRSRVSAWSLGGGGAGAAWDVTGMEDSGGNSAAEGGGSASADAVAVAFLRRRLPRGRARSMGKRKGG